jgi:hypothetical protein
MSDPTEFPRRVIQAEIHAEIESDIPFRERARLDIKYGFKNVWDTDELQNDFEVLAFMAPFCVVKRKSDGVKGSVQFQHDPRFYFNFQKA